MTHGIVHRGEPANVVPPPFKPPTMGGSVSSLPPMPGGALPSGLTMPTMSTGGFPKSLGVPFAPGTFGPMPPQPPPPPPPREDDPMFVRRVRLTHMERTNQVHAEQLLEEGQEVAWTTPNWVFTVMLLAPYMACLVSIVSSIIVDLVYALKFQQQEQQYWYYSCTIGIGLCLLVLEVIRCSLTVVVELRKFEIRRGHAGGAFLRSKLHKNAEEPAIQQRRTTATAKRPALSGTVPRVPPRGTPPPPPPASAPPTVSRPAFLPPEGPPPGAPPVRAGSGQLPVAPAPPGRPGVVPPLHGLGASAGHATPLGTPGSRGPPVLHGPMAGTPKTPIGTPGGTSLLPGALDGRLGSGGVGPGPGTPPAMQPMPPPLPGAMGTSPGGGPAGLLTREAQEKLKAAAARRGEAQPPSPSAAFPGGGPRPPSHQRSRPTSHRSAGSTPPKPPTPPPHGTFEQKRAQARAQQQSLP
mmetsp:Transcript_9015/g.16975  ORF Transcript_9015/g.16975 Transcript_9015/m.16975 type:complete len:466 (-) Transcript_9015:93-1490(-)